MDVEAIRLEVRTFDPDTGKMVEELIMYGRPNESFEEAVKKLRRK